MKKTTAIITLTCMLSTQSVFAKTLVDMTKTPQCFSAQYDAVHLKAHPKQKVSALWVYVPPAKPIEYGYGDMQKLASSMGQVMARFKNDKADYISDGMECTVESNDVWHCGIECDGGQFTLQANPNSAVFLKPQDSIRLTSCDGGKTRYIESIDDQKTFALRPTSLATCKRLMKKYQ